MRKHQPIFVALLAAAAAFGVRLVLDPVVHDRAPFLLSTLAVVAASVTGGTHVGLFATAISALVALWALVPPQGSLYLTSAESALEAATFVAISVAVFFARGHARGGPGSHIVPHAGVSQSSSLGLKLWSGGLRG